MDDLAYLSELYDEVWNLYIATGNESYRDQADEYLEEMTDIIDRRIRDGR